MSKHPNDAKRSRPPPPTDPEMAGLIDAVSGTEGMAASNLPGVKFLRASQHVPRSPIAYEPSIVVIAQGQKIGFLGTRRLVFDAWRYLVLSVPMPFECETFGCPESPLLGVSIGVTPEVVAELILALGEPPKRERSIAEPMQTAELDDELRAAVLRLLGCLPSSRDAAVLGPSIVREIIYRTLLGPLGWVLRDGVTNLGHRSRIRRILNRVHTDYARSLNVPSLACEAGMSVSTFHTRFKEMTATSPLRYIKSVRLIKARMFMVHDHLTASAAAYRVGYQSESQFSRDFRQHFGAPPAQIARQLRATLTRLD